MHEWNLPSQTGICSCVGSLRLLLVPGVHGLLLRVISTFKTYVCALSTVHMWMAIFFFCTDIPTLLRWRWWILILLAVWLLALAVIGVLRRRWGVALAFAVSFVHCKGKREKETGSCQAWTRGAGYYFFATAGFWCQTFFPSLSALLFLRTDQPSHQTIRFADNSTLQQLVFNNKSRPYQSTMLRDAAVLIDLISWGGGTKGLVMHPSLCISVKNGNDGLFAGWLA